MGVGVNRTIMTSPRIGGFYFLATLLLTIGPADARAQARQSLIVPGATVVKLAGGLQFTEGPAADARGDVFFSDIPTERIYKWSVADRTLTVFRENSGGANGLFFDGMGNLIVCEGTTRQITSISPDGQVTVIATRFEGRRFNRPNDLWIDSDGGIYFTDPAYAREAGQLELDADGVYYIPPDRRTVFRVSADLDRPNGIIGSTESRTLYVTEHRGRKTWAYHIHSDGSISDKKLFAPLGADGMTLDSLGNLYLTNLGNSSIDIYAPDGTLLESIHVPERPANLTLGGADRRTLFITATTSLYSIAMRARTQ